MEAVVSGWARPTASLNRHEHVGDPRRLAPSVVSASHYSSGRKRSGRNRFAHAVALHAKEDRRRARPYSRFARLAACLLAGDAQVVTARWSKRWARFRAGLSPVA